MGQTFVYINGFSANANHRLQLFQRSYRDQN